MYEDYDDDRPHDYGFDLPDNRYQFITEEGTVSISIVRNWYTLEESDEPDFKVSWNINYEPFNDYRRGNNKSSAIYLPIGSTEDQAIEIAHILWKEDAEATKGERELQAEYDAERRMGA
jgi:hypothetical protein